LPEESAEPLAVSSAGPPHSGLSYSPDKIDPLSPSMFPCLLLLPFTDLEKLLICSYLYDSVFPLERKITSALFFSAFLALIE
jgi:hypothetical protein